MTRRQSNNANLSLSCLSCNLAILIMSFFPKIKIGPLVLDVAALYALYLMRHFILSRLQRRNPSPLFLRNLHDTVVVTSVLCTLSYCNFLSELHSLTLKLKKTLVRQPWVCSDTHKDIEKEIRPTFTILPFKEEWRNNWNSNWEKFAQRVQYLVDFFQNA